MQVIAVPLRRPFAKMEPDDDLTRPVGTVEEKWKLLPHFLRMRGLMKQHIDSFDNFIDVGIKQIVAAQSNQVIRSEADKNYYIQYNNVEVKEPHYSEEFDFEHTPCDTIPVPLARCHVFRSHRGKHHLH